MASKQQIIFIISEVIYHLAKCNFVTGLKTTEMFCAAKWTVNLQTEPQARSCGFTSCSFLWPLEQEVAAEQEAPAPDELHIEASRRVCLRALRLR